MSASVCGTGSFSVHTATHSISGSTHEAQSFSADLWKSKKCERTLDATTLHFPLFPSIITSLAKERIDLMQMIIMIAMLSVIFGLTGT